MEEEAVAANENHSESVNSDVSVETEENEDVNRNVEGDASTSDNNDNSSSPPDTLTFDLNLPGSHSYLGTNLEELRGRILLDEGIHCNFPLLVKHSIVLFPGQTLPMSALVTPTIHMLLKCIQENRTFGMICHHNKLETIGTTAEIYEFLHNPDMEEFRIKAKGRQRFKVLDLKEDDYKFTGNIKILPEINLSSPCFKQRIVSLDSHRIYNEVLSSTEIKKQSTIERMDAAVSRWPAWVYRQYNPHVLASKVKKQLQSLNIHGCMSSDPTELSYWVGQNLPLNDRQKIMLLKHDSAIPRLQWELKYLTKNRILVCSHCETYIGKQSNLFAMSKEGVQSTFCNAGGYMHDTVTLYQAENLVLNSQSPSAEYSWFPGYAWTIAVCKGCVNHMGWKFTVDKDKTLRPDSFWGLTRSSIKAMVAAKHKKEYHSSDESSESDSDVECDNNLWMYG